MILMLNSDLQKHKILTNHCYPKLFVKGTQQDAVQKVFFFKLI